MTKNKLKPALIDGKYKLYTNPVKLISGKNKSSHCHHTFICDTYGFGCAFGCKYCYARAFHSMCKRWSNIPYVADTDIIKGLLKCWRPQIIRCGSMTDCFQPLEKTLEVTYKSIQIFNELGIHYVLLTKSDLIADDKYIDILDKDLCHIQITITGTDDKAVKEYEPFAPPVSSRIKAIEKLWKKGFDVSVRLSPFIPGTVDYDKLAAIECGKILIEFLRLSYGIKKVFDIDCKEYTVNQGGYKHLPLEKKIEYIKDIYGFNEKSVCEMNANDVDYWKDNFNSNKNDCCNLRGIE